MSGPETPNVDAVVIGAGFGGIYMLHKLRDGLGLKVRAYDKAGGVGGTWYWNKYPGAMSDTEAHIYQYSFDEEMLQDLASWSSGNSSASVYAARRACSSLRHFAARIG